MGLNIFVSFVGQTWFRATTVVNAAKSCVRSYTGERHSICTTCKQRKFPSVIKQMIPSMKIQLWFKSDRSEVENSRMTKFRCWKFATKLQKLMKLNMISVNSSAMLLPIDPLLHQQIFCKAVVIASAFLLSSTGNWPPSLPSCPWNKHSRLSSQEKLHKLCDQE